MRLLSSIKGNLIITQSLISLGILGLEIWAGFHLSALSDTLIASGLSADSVHTFETAFHSVLWGLQALALGASIWVYSAVTNPLQNMAKSLVQVRRGDLHVDIPGLDRPDVVGDIAQGVESIRKKTVDGFFAQSGLDNLDGNIMMTDLNGQVTYINGSMKSLLRKYAGDISSYVLNFSSDNWHEMNARDFTPFTNPNYDLANIRGNFQTDLKFGDVVFNVRGNSVLNASNEQLGVVLQWVDVTHELKSQDELYKLVEKVIAGDLSERIDASNKTGFNRELAQSFNRLLETLNTSLTDFDKMLTALANGNLKHRILSEYQGVFARLKNSANQTAETLTRTINSLVATSQTIYTDSEAILEGSTELSTRVEQQAANLEETAASMEEMASTVRQNAENAQQANTLAIRSRELAERGGTVVNKAVDAMNLIEQSSGQIADIIRVIDDIAFQTNLLSLNAAVEAARAGEAGKGFAVVAEEVRSLAQRSAHASKQIKDLIEDSGGRVSEGVSLVNMTGSSLQEIVDSAKKVADIIAEIAAASAEQSAGIEHINMAVCQMDDMTQKNAALVQQTTQSTNSLQSQADRLLESARFFGGVVDIKKKAPPASEKFVASRPQNSRSFAPGAKGIDVNKNLDAVPPVSVKTNVKGGLPIAKAEAAPLPLVMPKPMMASDDDWTEF